MRARVRSRKIAYAINDKTYTYSGNNLLLIAASNGQKRIVKELLRESEKIDVYAHNHKGQNAVECAREFKYEELAQYIATKVPLLQDCGISAGGADCGGGGEGSVQRLAPGLAAAAEVGMHAKAARSAEHAAKWVEQNAAAARVPGERVTARAREAATWAAMLIQRAVRCHAARIAYRLLLALEDAQYELLALRITAARMIQQAFRCHSARLAYYVLLGIDPEDLSEEDACAPAERPPTLPSAARALSPSVRVVRALEKQDEDEVKEEDAGGHCSVFDHGHAARMIQCAFRCFSARLVYYELLGSDPAHLEEEEGCPAAAAGWHEEGEWSDAVTATDSEMDEEVEQEEQDAKERILAWGFSSVSNVCGHEHVAASTIQCAFRCFSARLVYYELLGGDPVHLEEEAAPSSPPARAADVASAYAGEGDAQGAGSRIERLWKELHAGAEPGDQFSPAPHVIGPETTPAAAAAAHARHDTKAAWVQGGEELPGVCEELEELHVLDMDACLSPTELDREKLARAEGVVPKRMDARGERAQEEQAAAAPTRQRTRHVSGKSAKAKVTSSRTFVPWR